MVLFYTCMDEIGLDPWVGGELESTLQSNTSYLVYILYILFPVSNVERNLCIGDKTSPPITTPAVTDFRSHAFLIKLPGLRLETL